jgi:hypothetical protein
VHTSLEFCAIVPSTVYSRFVFLVEDDIIHSPRVAKKANGSLFIYSTLNMWKTFFDHLLLLQNVEAKMKLS